MLQESCVTFPSSTYLITPARQVCCVPWYLDGRRLQKPVFRYPFTIRIGSATSLLVAFYIIPLYLQPVNNIKTGQDLKAQEEFSKCFIVCLQHLRRGLRSVILRGENFRPDTPFARTAEVWIYGVLQLAPNRILSNSKKYKIA